MRIELAPNDKQLEVFRAGMASKGERPLQVLFDMNTSKALPYNGIRITDHQHILKVQFDEKMNLQDVLLDGIYVVKEGKMLG